MKTAKARIFMFDLECPHCSGLLSSPAGDGSLSWSFHEACPATAKCADCGEESKVPSRIPGERIQKESI